MLNAEKYKDELKEIRKNDYQIGRNKKTHKLFGCHGGSTKCDTCMFNVRDELCSDMLTDWLLEETPKYTLTQFEYLYLKNLKDEWKWIARDKVGSSLYIYSAEPKKAESQWISNGSCKYVIEIFSTDFLSFIKWEDEECYNINDILGNCEVIENA